MTVPGGSPLNYPIGSQPPIRRVSQNRAPTTQDYKNWREGDEWLDVSSNDWYKLADVSPNNALWVRIGGSGGPLESFLVDSGTSPVVPDSSNQIHINDGNGIGWTGGTSEMTGAMVSPFVGDFTFQSNTGGEEEILSCQNTVDAASSTAILEAKIAGTSSGQALWRVAVDGTASAFGIMTASGTNYALQYSNTDSGAATNIFYRVTSINAATGTSTMIVDGGDLAIGAEGAPGNGATCRVFSQFGGDCRFSMQVSGMTGDGRISYNLAGNNWETGVCRDADGDWFLTQAVSGEWPPSATNTRLHVEKALTGSIFCNQTGAIMVPVGTTGQRPSAPSNGMIRYNTSTAKFEGYEGGAWANLI